MLTPVAFSPRPAAVPWRGSPGIAATGRRLRRSPAPRLPLVRCMFRERGGVGGAGARPAASSTWPENSAPAALVNPKNESKGRSAHRALVEALEVVPAQAGGQLRDVGRRRGREDLHQMLTATRGASWWVQAQRSA